MGESLVDRLQLEGYVVRWYRNGASALVDIPKQNFSLVLSDVRLPDLGGDKVFELLCKTTVALPPFLFITAYGTIERAVELLRLGAMDYITKPFEIEELLKKILLHMRVDPYASTDRFAYARSPAMAKLSSLLPKYARSSELLLITGESGVGKEYIARIIHELDETRSGKPFLAINCGAIPEPLAESELFGHEHGTFTGAIRQRRGAFEQAQDGILFLDEVGDLPATVQVKLLRVLEDKHIVRLGGEASIPIHCRVIAATNRKIDADIAQGLFRADLFYRLNALHLHVPPLRERREEIGALAKIFLADCNRRTVDSPKVFAADADLSLYGYDWPGNIRELKNCVGRGHLVSERNIITRQDLFDDSTGQDIPVADATLQLDSFIAQQERAFLLEQLTRHDGKIAKTAAVLGISRKTLWEKMRKYGISGREGVAGNDVPMHKTDPP